MTQRIHIPMDEEHLKRFAHNSAKELTPAGRRSGRAAARGLVGLWRQIEGCRAGLSVWSAGVSALPPAAEWLLDNAYLAQRCILDAERALRRCPPLRGTRGEEAVVFRCARAAVWAVPDLDTHRLGLFLEGFQQVLPLTEGELSVWIPAMVWAVSERLAKLCRQPEDFKQGGEGSAQSEEMAQIFAAYRALSGREWGELLEGASLLERLLSQDPSGHYPQMDEETRARYRAQVCALARRTGQGEAQTARRVLELAQKGTGPRRHVGWYLYREPLGRRQRQATGAAYGAGILLLTLTLAITLGSMLHSVLAALLLVLPLSDIVKNCVDFLASHLVPPRPVHRMELKGGIPPQARTVCVVACLLTGEDSGDKLCALLERYRLANRDSGEQLRFGLLADLPDSDAPMGKEQRNWVRRTQRAVDALNAKYGGGFYLFFRAPSFQKADERYMGWERKRGALVELVRLLKNRRSGVQVLAGDRSALADTKYIITLDTDTSLNVGAARELVGAMEHPLNTPQVDAKRRVVTAGYGLLQPRISVELEAANQSLFSRIFAGQGGVDPYASTASDVYHDLFDQGSYTGKGIFQVDAFFTCLDRRLPDNAVLSHDLLEGSYLHAGLLGEVELTDGFPYKVNSYFARLHRWVRGDWQLLPWLLPTVPTWDGTREKNPLPALARWKMADNLRRSLSPASTLVALVLGICLSGRVFAAAAAVAVLSAASNLLLSGVELCARRGAGSRTRYHSAIIAGFAGVVLQTVVQLLFLPYQAYICTTAACTALWRLGVSHKNMLAWVTADQAQKGDAGSLWGCVRRQWFAVGVGLVTLWGAQLRIGMAVGLIWLLSPLGAWWMSRKREKEPALSPSERTFLLHQASLIWGYFADFLRPEDHYLPPDNYQERPAAGLARRTSPTNMGMALLCVMAAADLDLIPRERGVELLGHMLDTLEGLDKWHGHLYNWYDTATAAPLSPRYVSTVDSGNLCGSLIALREGLYEWGQDVLARRAEALSDGMDFSLLFDRRRRLFTIGFEVEKGKCTDGYYDLMASEARQTSYIAIARGEVTPRHWRRLGRMLVRENDYSGMTSWTGTMFEYFMPNLLLPCEPNSLMYESLAFCVYAQRRRAAKARVPWGISESGFYAFDAAQNYQYKAHGVQALGLKRGLDRELVIAPYASFLALALTPRSAVANLRRLRDMGLEGKYGLYEAADFTPARAGGQGRFEVVRSFMVHHLGMSLVAIDNALSGGVMQRRFLRDCSMSAYRELLQERVPVGAAIVRPPEREVPEKPRRYGAQPLAWEGTAPSRLAPERFLLGDGDYTVLCSANGESRSCLGETALTLDRPGESFAPAGISWFFKDKDGLFSLTRAPLYREGEYGWSFDGRRFCWTARRGALSAVTAAQVSPGGGEVRSVQLSWEGRQSLEGELFCYLEPVLARRRDYDAHPAFSKLFLESVPLFRGAAFLRHSRGGETNPALALVWEGEEATFTTSREKALGRGGLRSLDAWKPGPLNHETGGVLDPCLLLRVPVSLRSGQSLHFRVSMAAGEDVEQAEHAALRLFDRHTAQSQGARPLEEWSRRLGLDERGCRESFELLRRLSAVHPPKPDRPPQSALWPWGVSGDFPIALGAAEGKEGTAQALAWCRQHRLLSRLGYRYDLVLLLDEGGDYRRPVRSALTEGLKELGAESALGGRGGIHLLPCAGEDTGALYAWAGAYLPLEPVEYPDAPAPSLEPLRLKSGLPQVSWEPGGEIRLELDGRLPPAGWSQLLCNRQFGWITDETGVGFLWKGNSREGRLTPWSNDPLQVGGWERLSLEREGRERSVFADGDGLPCAVTYGPGFARWEKRWGGGRVTTTAFVPPEVGRRVLLLTLEGLEGTLLLRQGEGEQRFPVPVEGRLALTTWEEGGVRTSDQELTWEQGQELLEQTRRWWRSRVCALTVRTPDPALDHYLNLWGLYQVMACRVFARTSQYQNGGAYGFRDQLQDVCALVMTAPELAREQLVTTAGRQFEEGDVQHWWHPPQGKGVRTRISDDLLWLPYAAARYVKTTGDWSVLAQTVPYLTSPPLEEGETERYEQPQTSSRSADVYTHALDAIRCVLARGAGAHGLARMGGGDWNDGMNRVGEKGRGESVWLTWFLVLVLHDFAPLCRQRGEADTARELLQYAQDYSAAAQRAWDGEWYLRGYYDDGTPLGSRNSGECRIDSIAQSFAVLAPGGDRERAERAVESALEQLFDREHQIVKLLAPPFRGAGKDPGYIKGYLPGVRENGGQYTHAGVWLALACLRLGKTEEGWQLLKAILPEHHDREIFRTEPYVLSADVYAHPDHPGRGGWSWYTGAAGWYWRTAVEELLGITLEDGALWVRPNLPEGWPGYQARWQAPNGAVFSIAVEKTGQKKTLLDGKEVQQGIAWKKLSGEHGIRVEM